MSEEVILYTVGCPRCAVLEEKLNSKNIKFAKIEDEEYMASIGLDEMPVLQVGNKKLQFAEANKWINEQ